MDTELIAYLDRRFDGLAEHFDHRLDQVDHRLDRIDQRLDQHDQRFEQIDHRFERVDDQLRGIHVLIEGLDSKIQLVAEGVLSGAEARERLRLEMERRFDEVIEINRASYADLDRRLREDGW